MRGDSGVILAAAGSGKRFGARKQLLEILGRPLIHFSLDALGLLPDVASVVLVMPAEDLETGTELVERWRRGRVAAGAPPDGLPLLSVIAGGVRRQDSVTSGLRHLRGTVRWVLVHDAARPLLQPADAQRVLDATRARGAAVIGTPMTDSVKRVREGMVLESLPRDEIWTVQTPQGAELEVLLAAYQAGAARELTDEVSALSASGVSVAIVEGPRQNFKITRAGDQTMAEHLLRSRAGE